MKKSILLSFACLGIALAAPAAFAQEDIEAAAAAGDNAIEASASSPAPRKQSEFMQVLFGSGWLGTVLWIALLSTIGIYIWLVIDCSLTVTTKKIIPQTLIDNVEGAMKEGDVVKALQCCANEPGPMANILSAGFNHVEEGFDVIQEAISTAADLEVEKIQQRLGWFSVDGNVAPMLGLLGTVQGMILAFKNMAGATVDVAVLSSNISQALWTTAFGLVAAIPCVVTYYAFRNNANKIVLRMEAITMELVKGLRNVEVVSE